VKNWLQVLQKYLPGRGPWGINLNFVVAAQMQIVRPMIPICTSAVSTEPQDEQVGNFASSNR